MKIKIIGSGGCVSTPKPCCSCKACTEAREKGLPYGYGWWVGTFNDVKYHIASGFGGQIVGVIPDRNTVVTILSEMDRPHPENKKIIEMIISEQYNA